MTRETYVSHDRNLNHIVELGAIVKIKRVVSFTQSKFTQRYIDFNNEHIPRAKSNKHDFLVSLFKLFSNSVYGKTLESIRNRQNAHLTVDRENAVKWMSKLEFKDAAYVKGLYSIQTYTPNIGYDRPVFLGGAILDKSKLHTINFHYSTIHKHFEGNYKLLYSDTDRMSYCINHNDLYTWMKDNV